VKGRLFLNVVVRKCSSVLQLLSGEYETLLVGRNAFLVLNLGLDIVNGVGGFHLQGDGLSSQSLDEDLHATTEAENEMERRLLLNIVIGKSATVFKLFTSKNKALLVGRDTLLVLNLGLHVVNGVRRLNLQGDCLPGKGLDKDLHATTETENWGDVSQYSLALNTSLPR